MKLNDMTMEQNTTINTSFGYSATRIDELGASEYTLVTLVVDRSGSISGFEKDMNNCIKEVVKACQLSPRADNLMIRLVVFDNELEEIHGFKMLQNCILDDYSNIVKARNTTALFDAFKTSVDATTNYAKSLADNDFGANAIVVVITDGIDNASKFSTQMCKDSLTTAVKSEALESIRSILIGVDVNYPSVKAALQEFKDLTGIDQYEEIEHANAKTLAKLADFVSKSISAQSQSLGTGGPSKPISLSI